MTIIRNSRNDGVTRAVDLLALPRLADAGHASGVHRARLLGWHQEGEEAGREDCIRQDEAHGG